jgi:hypothetical protein
LRPDPERQESLVPLSPPTEETRWRCALCGNLTRFDVERTVRSRDFVHVDLAGVAVVEEREIVGETIERVTCRWCGHADSVELVARPAADLPTDQVAVVDPVAGPAVHLPPSVDGPVLAGQAPAVPAVPAPAPVSYAEPVPPAVPVPYAEPVGGPAGPVPGLVPRPVEVQSAPEPVLEPVRAEPVDGDPVADAIAAAEPVAPPP